MAKKTLCAPLYDLTPPLSVEALIGPRHPTPGNVGVCLCGGSSRAMSAGMGQLRALATLQANGRPLLSQVKAISAVSGGAWLAAPYTYLKAGISDQAYLGTHVADPGRLTPKAAPGQPEAEVLEHLPEGNIGQAVTQHRFGAASLNLRCLVHKAAFDVPQELTWQVLIGLDILERYGLYDPAPSDKMRPSSLFSLDAEALERDVLRLNPQLRGVTAHLYADALDPSRAPRPYLICNFGMFLAPDERGFQALVPVQSTPLFTGVIGRSEGLSQAGASPGGRAVASFAFGGVPRRTHGDEVELRLKRPWSLADAVGTSSSFYAETLQNSAFQAVQQRDRAAADFAGSRAELEAVLDSARGGDRPRPKLLRLVEGAKHRAAAETLDAMIRGGRLAEVAEELQEIVPEYPYWPPDAGAAPRDAQRERFSDGGTLENTGVASLLAYRDIDSVIAFVNSSKAMRPAERGVLDADGEPIPGTSLFIENQVPPLFGYQPYREDVGYRLYAGDEDPNFPNFGRSQVFESAVFPELLRALWGTIGNGKDPEAFARPAIFKRALRVLPNPWFGVVGRGGPGDTDSRPVTLVLVYTQRVRAWYEQLSPEVQRLLGPFDDTKSFHDFPHYSTFDTCLSPEQVNLLAHLTDWTVSNEESAPLFTSLFET